MKIEDLKYFCMVADNGSYTITAKKESVSTSKLARRIITLEKDLNIKLINSKNRKINLTCDGLKFYRKCQPLLNNILDITERISDEYQRVIGRLRIAASIEITEKIIQPLINDFIHNYPDIKIELYITHDINLLHPIDWDIIFSVGPLRNSTLIARRINKVQDILVASPDYLKKNPALTHAEDLRKHFLLKSKALLSWKLIHQNGEIITINKNSRFEANEPDVVLKACCDGLGIALIPNIIAQKYITSGELVSILDKWFINPRDVNLLYNYKNNQPEKLRLFIKYAINHSFL